MVETGKRTAWARRITFAALALSIGGVAAALIGALGSGQEAWHFRIGFTILRSAFFAAIAGGVLALAGLALGRKLPGLAARNLLALAIALAFVIYLGDQIRTARTVPAIHEISTDLDDIPQFSALSVRADHLEYVPDMGRPELAAMAPEERWKAIHREAYGDIRTVSVRWSVAETIERAEDLARGRGWDIAHADREAGVMEATDTTTFFRFKDDIALRAREAPEGGTLVDMRSISRVGGSDVGVNAKRVRAFLADLGRG